MGVALPQTTTPAILPRAGVETFCWYSTGLIGENTAWKAFTYDPARKIITSIDGFPYWIDGDGSNWRNTDLIETSCGNGVIVGKSYSGACASPKTCLTESMFAKSGDATPKLSKVMCREAYSPRVYYIESPPAKRADTPSTTPALTPASITSEATNSPSAGSSVLIAGIASPSISSPTVSQTDALSSPSPTNGNSNGSNGSNDSTTSTGSSSSSGPNAGAIAGGVIGGIAVLGAIVLGALWILRRGKKQKASSIQTEQVEMPAPQYQPYAQYPGPQYPVAKHEVEVAELPVYSDSTKPGELPAETWRH